MAAASGNATLTSAAAQPNGVSTSTRPATQSAASAASGAPVGVGRLRPVAPGGEEEADDHRQRETEQHFVRVPHRPGEVGAAEQPANCSAHSADRQRREDAGQQVERAKAQIPQREARRRRGSPAALRSEDECMAWCLRSTRAPYLSAPGQRRRPATVAANSAMAAHCRAAPARTQAGVGRAEAEPDQRATRASSASGT